MKTTIKMIALVAVIIAVLNACGKKNDKPFSTFKIDGVEYKTNNVQVIIAHLNSRFTGGDSISFVFGFNGSGLPSDGERNLVLWNEEAAVNEIELYFKIMPIPLKIYALSPRDSSHKITISTSDGVKTISLEPSWFLREPDGEDSFLAEGIFVLPEVEKI